MVCHFFFFKQKTAYEMRISDWSSDVCSSDLELTAPQRVDLVEQQLGASGQHRPREEQLEQRGTDPHQESCPYERADHGPAGDARRDYPVDLTIRGVARDARDRDGDEIGRDHV